jgi:dihydrolipoamide dehydrogenase
MATNSFDVAVLGGGPGGYVAAIRASELIHEIAVAMKGELIIDDLATTVHSHPTLSEAVMEAAEDCFGIATHKS